MIKVFLFIIMTSISLKLNALDLTTAQEKLKQLEEMQEVHQANELAELVKKARKAKKEGNDFAYKLFREEEIRNDQTCNHCPKHILLTEQINKVVEEMAKKPEIKNNRSAFDLPVKINRMKFLYYTLALKDRDGNIHCNRYLDNTPDLKPTKFDGQFKLIAEDALKFSSVTDVQYINHDLDEVVYYYRGEGTEKNIIVQAIMTKEGGKFRYYRYTPSAKEENPYNLPDLSPSPSVAVIKEEPKAEPMEISRGVSAPAIGLQSADVKLKADIETSGIIPKNVKFLEAKVEQDIVGFKLKGSTTTSLKGNDAVVSLNNGKDNIAVINLTTKMNGKTDAVLTVPYSVRVTEDLPKVTGNYQHRQNEDLVTMSVEDKETQYIRSEVRKNKVTDSISYVVAKDFVIDKQVLSLQYGKGEDNKRYTSFKHINNIKDNVTLVLDVKVDSDRKASVFYKVEAKF